MIVSYKDFTDGIRREIWPTGAAEPENLTESNNTFFQEAMFEAAKYVECLKGNNNDVHPFCATYQDCAMTVIPAPANARIVRVFTIANDDWCDPVFYDPDTIAQLRCFSRNLAILWAAPENAGMPPLPGGMRRAEPTSDIEDGRNRTGIYALHNNRIYLAPWIQSNEKVVVEYKGRKSAWGDDDQLDTDKWTLEVRKYVKLYVSWRHEAAFGCDRQKKLDLKAEMDDALAEAMHSCEESKRLPENEECASVNPHPLTTEEREDDAVPAADDEIVFAVIGDYGDPDYQPKPTQVSDLVKSWDPDFIVTVGDNIYSPATTYEEIVGLLYGDFITGQLSTNRFWPAIGNHDHNDPANGIQDYFDYFTLPGNERYYDFVKGPVHFFVLHSGIQGNDQDDSEEEDGIQVTDAQAEWLRVRMLLSTAKWKVVIVHDAPYTSGAANVPGFSYLRWPYKTWGADVVLSGDSHGYERLVVDELPYIVNGAGGTQLLGFGAVQSGSQIRYNADNGAMRCRADCETLEMKFYNTAGELIDTLELSQ